MDSREAAVWRHQERQLEDLRREEAALNAPGEGKLPIAGGASVEKRSADGSYQVKDTETHVIKIQAEPSNSYMRIKQLVAGGGAGAITKTAVAPLERVKILLQVQGMKMADRSKSDFKYRGVLGTMRTVLKEEGVLALYKGNGANVLRVVPVYALKFTFNDTFKDMVRTSNEPLSFGQLIMAGTLAGLFQTCVTYPLETVRTRLTLGSGLGVQFNGITDVLVQTVRKEGIAGLYKGIGPTFLSGSPYVGLQMTFYEIFKRRLEGRQDGQSVLTIQVEKLLAGASAGVIAQTITYPGDTIRRRMQMNGMNGEAKLYKNSWECSKLLVQREGFAGLFNGLGANLIRCLPGAAIQFWAYDFLNALIKDL
ncbi:Mitochondrial carrier protein [Hondaea fermentalgiana]|uniref:Mitochondrial carrier protein n=1 Tax=Hondaea fermentalgiana TaxID=2315210 RepID=A0A2R5GK77_9STRA|nr:Mitochondrial carrier protein [Hondaea fermentalgiana]|eukprot:GBG28681.1 Mitochondrial carrier protein [Hondaea fermentalgiana]